MFFVKVQLLDWNLSFVREIHYFDLILDTVTYIPPRRTLPCVLLFILSSFLLVLRDTTSSSQH